MLVRVFIWILWIVQPHLWKVNNLKKRKKIHCNYIFLRKSSEITVISSWLIQMYLLWKRKFKLEYLLTTTSYKMSSFWYIKDIWGFVMLLNVNLWGFGNWSLYNFEWNKCSLAVRWLFDDKNGVRIMQKISTISISVSIFLAFSLTHC